ncbi:MAG: amidohydrolase family protein [Candidatus Omnitrophota bacterium]
MPKILDAQSHYMPPEVARHTTFFKVHWSDAERQLEVMDQHHIDKALLLYPTSDAHKKMGGWANVCEIYNQGIADIVTKYSSRFIGAGIIPVDHPASIPRELIRIKKLGMKVISLASSYEGKYLDDEIFLPVFAFAQKENMPVHVHPQIIHPIGEERISDPLLSPVLEYVFDVTMTIGQMMMNGIFQKYPDVKFIFAHYGGVLPFLRERFDNTYTMLRKRDLVKDIGKNPSEYFKNLYFDTSGSKSPSALSCMLEVVDANHVLWASDYPANQNMASSISFLDDLSLSSEHKNAILFDNLARLLSKG